MNVKISSPEILFVLSGVLFLADKVTPGTVFAVLGVIGTITRVALEAQVRQEKSKSDQETLRSVARALSSVIKIFSGITVQHYDDSTEYN